MDDILYGGLVASACAILALIVLAISITVKK